LSLRPHERLRELVRAEVRGLPPPADLREHRSRLRLLAALDRLRDPFARLAGPTHVTGSAIVTGARGIVLHRHRRMGIWLQPGGHLEPGETPWQAAAREASEETGMALRHPLTGPRLVHVDVHRAPFDHLHLDLRYLLLAPDRDPCPPPGESQDVRWFDWPEALALADEGLAGALRKGGIRPPPPVGGGPGWGLSRSAQPSSRA
jgi:8-oxo-dGTP pyrophosphatase MutT (NUDIX family)